MIRNVSRFILKIFFYVKMRSLIFFFLSMFTILSFVAVEHFAKGDLPILLWWTQQIYPHTNDNMTLIRCGDVKCYSTKSRGYLDNKNTKGIMFYGTGIDPLDLPLPRLQDHEWCLFHEESPLNNYLLSHEHFIHLFNHTATFKRESDYPITTQDIFALEYLTERQAIDIKVKNEKQKSDGFAALMYTQSHADVPSYRDSYVKELMKYIDVDSYGTCLHNKDLPENLINPAESFQKDQFLDFIAGYKFHLSFENAVCDDYMTEKLMRPLHLGSVPIYYGSPKAKDWMPNNHSIIMVNDFNSPKELAEFIKYLDENDEEYLKYLNFKKPNGITNTLLKETVLNRDWGSHDHKYYFYNIEDKVDYYQGFECHVCREIHKRMNALKEHEKDPSKPKPPPKIADNSHLGCPKPFSPLSGQEIPSSHWSFTYEDTKTVADAVVEMLRRGEEDPSLTYMYYSQLKKKQNSHNTGEL
ncbi:alpha-(1,3)-fucosyltransferase 11-like [Mytilus californianus]|uniref:alpha-(1,3)-fucosyltransferase 11-like n=1 Tax=Mytilus californianus TaxID=6549 RepID=UPI00224500F8|nr:alpha-(1,3)-fucosyltransferase 11-like [Mytilus californianus]